MLFENNVVPLHYNKGSQSIVLRYDIKKTIRTNMLAAFIIIAISLMVIDEWVNDPVFKEEIKEYISSIKE